MFSKKVLLYIITQSEIGGAQSNVLDLISGFQEDYDVHLATRIEGQLTESVKAINVPVHLLSNLVRPINLLHDYYGIQECISLIGVIKPDIIHAHSSKCGLIARIAGWISGVPVVFTAHGWGFSPGTPLLRRWIAWLSEKLAAPLGKKIVCVSESDRQLAIKFGIGTKNSLVTIHNGINNIPIPVANPSVQPPRLIMVARFNEQKDQATLLKAISSLFFPFHLDFVGSGASMESCQALAESLGVKDKVSFLGDRTDVPQLLAQSQIFILTSHYEGLPISILEAMRAGLPVIATKVNGIPEEVEHGKTGLLVSDKDVKEVAKALSILIESPELRQQMGEAARKKFLEEFTIERMLDETRIVYEQVLKQ
jgi:glycosyltransferase involved in cell wall biosynthesis